MQSVHLNDSRTDFEHISLFEIGPARSDHVVPPSTASHHSILRYRAAYGTALLAVAPRGMS